MKSPTSFVRPKTFDWLLFNLNLAAKRFGEQKIRLALALDQSFNSFKPKCNPDNPFLPQPDENSLHGKKSLTISLLSPDTDDCLLLRSIPVSKADAISGADSAENANEQTQCLAYLWDHRQELLKIADIVVGDTAFSERFFVDGLQKIGFQLVSRFRNDTPLSYIYDGPPTGLRGRPKKYDGAIDCSKLDFSKAKPVKIKPSLGTAFSLPAWSNALERTVTVVVHFLPGGAHRVYFSTDETLTGIEIFRLYRLRSRFEDSLRDAQQAHRPPETDENAILTSLNLMKRVSPPAKLPISRKKTL